MTRVLILVMTSAITTFLIRSTPFFFFSKKELPDLVKYFGKYLPFALMPLFVVFALRNIDKNSFLNLAWRIITDKLAIISGRPNGYSKISIFLRAKTTKSGIRAKGRYLPKYLTRSGNSFF